MTKSAVAGELFISQHVDLDRIDLQADYDLTFAALSWEKRSSSAISAVQNLKSGLILLRFASSDPDIAEKKEAQLQEFKKLSADCKVINLNSSLDFLGNSRQIQELLRTKAAAKGRPLRILWDITCFPKAYLLFVLGLCFTRSYVSRMDCIYAEGEYSLDISHADLHADAAKKKGIISEGDWTSLQIPYLEAETALPPGRDLFVTMGGEVGLSLPFLERYEPNRLGLVLISESLIQQPDKLPEPERLAISEILAEPRIVRCDISLTNVVELLQQADNFCFSTKEQVVTGVAIGSKPHALGLGIAALSHPNMEVVCRIPQRYVPLDVEPAGRFATYVIEDRFEPTAYMRF
ncbi:hypothetical protein [Methylobacterium sp. SD21]|uniref:hypothetical protein n=1 Tax=Methylobacterium litchii TaxID=3138810 RepID=UPI00313E65FF